jgi:hypothetical protein
MEMTDALNDMLCRMGFEGDTLQVTEGGLYDLCIMAHGNGHEMTPPCVYGGINEPNPESTSPRWIRKYAMDLEGN